MQAAPYVALKYIEKRKDLVRKSVMRKSPEEKPIEKKASAAKYWRKFLEKVLPGVPHISVSSLCGSLYSSLWHVLPFSAVLYLHLFEETA
jgi:hypothetical protein